MLRRPISVGIFSIGVMTLGAGMACGQEYPSKPIRVLTGPVGGSADIFSRQIAAGISTPLGQPVIVDNRGGGPVAGDAASKAPPDGYTLLITGASFWIETLLQKLPYDPV